MPQGGGAFDHAFEQGQKIGSRIAERNALTALAQNPEDPEGLRKLWAVNPEMAMKVADYQDRRGFSRAVGEYLGGNALAGTAATASRPSVNAFANLMSQASPAPPPAMPGASSNVASAPMTAQQNMPQAESQGSTAAPAADLSFLGQPKDGRDHAFMRMLKSDPIRALKIQSTMRDTFLNRLKGEHDFYGVAVEELGRVQDDAGWHAALQRLSPYADALGVDLGENVPLTYPGPEEVRSLMEHAMPIKDQLAHVLQQTNMEADNARADRNTDSLIADRAGRRAESARYNSQRIETTRRGQDLAASRPRGDGGKAPLPVFKTPDEARKMPSGTKFRTPDGRVMMVP